MNKNIYIYNKQQALFYINNGVMSIDVGIHKKSLKEYWVFNRQTTNHVFNLWMQNKE